MSQWAVFYANASQYLKRVSRLFLYWGAGRIVLLFLIALSLTLIISDDNVIADVLFQSPAESPVAEPPPPEPPPAEPPAAEPPPAEPPAAEPPPAEPPAAEPPPAEAPPAEPPPAEPATDIVSPISPVESISPILPTGSEPPPINQPAPAPGGLELEDVFIEEGEEETPSNFILDQVELVDTIVVSGAYIWLCCGIAFFLLIPLVFLLLQIRGQIKIRQEEDF